MSVRALLRPLLAVALALTFLPRSAAAQERDDWNLVSIDGGKSGYAHEKVTRFEKNDRKLWRTDSDAVFVINRQGTSLKLLESTWVIEDEAGQLIEQHSESEASTQKQIHHLEVQGDRATLTTTTIGAPQVKTIDWKKEYLGPVGRRRFLAEKVKAGEKAIDFEDFAFDLGVASFHVAVLGREKVTLPGREPLELQHLRMTIPSAPGRVSDDWYDDSWIALKSTLNVGFELVFVASTRADCIEAVARPDAPDLLAKASPRSNVRIPDPYHVDELVLHLRKERAGDLMPTLEDERQTVLSRKSDQDLVLRVRRVVPEAKFALPLAGLTDGEKACLKSNAMIQCDDPEIVKLAKATVGDEKDAWTAAAKLEHFACGYISKKGYGTGFASASEVCREKTGDCSEHGVFLAALCRAVGIPARVTVGFLYFGGGAWGPHMWAEVSLGGKWYALDAVLGKGSVDACHLRLAADSLNEIGLDRAFSNLGLGMGMDIDVVSYRHGDREMKVGEDAVVFRIDGQNFEHLLYGFSLDAPADYTIKPSAATSLSDNGVVDFVREGAPRVHVDVIDVTADFTLDLVKGMLGGQGIVRLKSTDRDIDGRPGRLLRGKRGTTQVVVAAVLREETLFILGSELEEGQSDDALLAVVDSLDLDAGRDAN